MHDAGFIRHLERPRSGAEWRGIPGFRGQWLSPSERSFPYPGGLTQSMVTNEKTPASRNDKGVLVSASRGDKTPLELFLAGIASFDARTRAMLGQRMVRLG